MLPQGSPRPQRIQAEAPGAKPGQQQQPAHDGDIFREQVGLERLAEMGVVEESGHEDVSRQQRRRPIGADRPRRQWSRQ